MSEANSPNLQASDEEIQGLEGHHSSDEEMPLAHKLEEKLAKQKSASVTVKCKQIITSIEEIEGNLSDEPMEEDEDPDEEIDPSEIELGPVWSDEQLQIFYQGKWGLFSGQHSRNMEKDGCRSDRDC